MSKISVLKFAFKSLSQLGFWWTVGEVPVGGVPVGGVAVAEVTVGDGTEAEDLGGESLTGSVEVPARQITSMPGSVRSVSAVSSLVSVKIFIVKLFLKNIPTLKLENPPVILVQSLSTKTIHRRNEKFGEADTKNLNKER